VKLREALARLDAESGGHAAYASFSAAEFQSPHVRQPKTWLSVRAHDLLRFKQLVAAKPVYSGENLSVLLLADDGVFSLGDGGVLGAPRLGCTNAGQTYLDLWPQRRSRSRGGGSGAEAILATGLKTRGGEIVTPEPRRSADYGDRQNEAAHCVPVMAMGGKRGSAQLNVLLIASRERHHERCIDFYLSAELTLK